MSRRPRFTVGSSSRGTPRESRKRFTLGQTSPATPETPRPDPPKFALPGQKRAKTGGPMTPRFSSPALATPSSTPSSRDTLDKFVIKDIHDSPSRSGPPVSRFRTRAAAKHKLKWSPSPKKRRSFFVQNGISDTVQAAAADVTELLRLGYSKPHPQLYTVKSVHVWNRFCQYAELDDYEGGTMEETDTDESDNEFLSQPTPADSSTAQPTKVLLISPAQSTPLSPGVRIRLGPQYTTTGSLQVYLDWIRADAAQHGVGDAAEA